MIWKKRNEKLWDTLILRSPASLRTGVSKEIVKEETDEM